MEPQRKNTPEEDAYEKRKRLEAMPAAERATLALLVQAMCVWKEFSHGTEIKIDPGALVQLAHLVDLHNQRTAGGQ